MNKWNVEGNGAVEICKRRTITDGSPNGGLLSMITPIILNHGGPSGELWKQVNKDIVCFLYAGLLLWFSRLLFYPLAASWTDDGL